MSDEIIRRIINETEYDVSREDSLRSIVREPFRKQHRSVLYVVVFFLVSLSVLAVWVSVLFFQAAETWEMILYATLFNTLMLGIACTRLFVWQTIHRGHVQRDVRRVEARIIELANRLALQEK